MFSLKTYTYNENVYNYTIDSVSISTDYLKKGNYSLTTRSNHIGGSINAGVKFNLGSRFFLVTRFTYDKFFEISSSNKIASTNYNYSKNGFVKGEEFHPSSSNFNLKVSFNYKF